MRAFVSLSWIKGADIIMCTVYYNLFLLAVLLLLVASLLQVILDPCRGFEHPGNIPARIIEDRFAQSVLAWSIATCVFCLQCIRAIWSRVFRGEYHSVISKIVANEWMVLVGPRRDALLLIISSVIFTAYFLCGAHNCMTTHTTSCDLHCYSK